MLEGSKEGELKAQGKPNENNTVMLPLNVCLT